MWSHSLSVDQTFSLCSTRYSFPSETDGAKALNHLPSVPLQAKESLSPHWENKYEVLHTAVLIYGAALATSHQRCPLPWATTAPGATCCGLHVCTTPPPPSSVLFTAGPQPLYAPVGGITSTSCKCLNKNQTLLLNFVFSFSAVFTNKQTFCLLWVQKALTVSPAKQPILTAAETLGTSTSLNQQRGRTLCVFVHAGPLCFWCCVLEV